MNRTVGLRSLYRDAPGLVEPVLVIHGGQVIGRYVPVAAAEATADLPDGSSREIAKAAGTVEGPDVAVRSTRSGGLLSGRERQHERDKLLERMRSRP